MRRCSKMGRAARPQQEASAAPPRVPEGYNRPRRLHQSAPCNRQAQTFASIFRPAWRSTELASRWRAGAAGESSQWGHRRGAGRRRWARVKSGFIFPILFAKVITESTQVTCTSMGMRGPWPIKTRCAPSSCWAKRSSRPCTRSSYNPTRRLVRPQFPADSNPPRWSAAGRVRSWPLCDVAVGRTARLRESRVPIPSGDAPLPHALCLRGHSCMCGQHGSALPLVVRTRIAGSGGSALYGFRDRCCADRQGDRVVCE